MARVSNGIIKLIGPSETADEINNTIEKYEVENMINTGRV